MISTSLSAEINELLDVEPRPLVFAVDETGAISPLPPDVELDNPVRRLSLDSAMLADLVVDAHRLTVTWLIRTAIASGSSTGTVRLDTHPQVEAAMHLFDLRESHGILFAAVLGVQEDVQLAVATRDKPIRCCIRIDKQGFIIAVDDAFTQLLGWSDDDVTASLAVDLLDVADRSGAIADWMYLVSVKEYKRTLRHRYRHKDGRWVWFEVTKINQLTGPEGCVLQEMHDVTAEMAAEEAMRLRDATYRQIVDFAREGILLSDADGVITFVNGRLAELAGRSAYDLVGRTVASVFEESEPDEVRGWIEGDSNMPAAGKIRGKGGIMRDVLVVGAPIKTEAGRHEGSVCMVTDVSDRVKLEDDLRQAQKLEALGRLAAGIAHEINTPVQFLSNNLQFLTVAFETLIEGATSGKGVSADEAAFFAEEVPTALKELSGGLERIAELVAAMRSVGRVGDDHVGEVVLQRCLRDTILVSRHEYHEVATLHVEIDDDEDVNVVGSSGALSQVFINLIVNAAHAIEDRHGRTTEGEITVRLQHDDERALITFTDNGNGIPPSVQDKLFEPFFTTKEVGKGTGQGLSIAKSIIEKHNGRIWFHTQPGVGTSFMVELPVHATELPDEVNNSNERATRVREDPR
jgi:PAS domain S-box-containing protein